MKTNDRYTDTEIIEKIIAGETALFEILIRRNNSVLYKTGRSYNINHEDTQDLMQDTFINAYLNLAKFENRSSFRTWLIKIMLNNCYKKKHKRSHNAELINDTNDRFVPMFSDNNNNTHSKIMNNELNHVIEDALKRVPEDYRMVFSLREISGLNVKETAEALNITESNVKVRLNRAKTVLRKEIEKSYTADEIFEFNLVYCDAMVKRVMDNLLLEENNLQ
jgi:RNA polymerase sigma factor (sigma-70 family)